MYFIACWPAKEIFYDYYELFVNGELLLYAFNACIIMTNSSNEKRFLSWAYPSKSNCYIMSITIEESFDVILLPCYGSLLRDTAISWRSLGSMKPHLSLSKTSKTVWYTSISSKLSPSCSMSIVMFAAYLGNNFGRVGPREDCVEVF